MPTSPKHQTSLQLIAREVNHMVIDQRASDGYINATQLCSVAGKRWHNYVREETTGHFLRALEAKTGISGLALKQDVVDAQGVLNTWVHPKVAIHLAQWLSADFAVQVSEWVYEWISGSQPQGSQMPYHLRRHMLNLAKIPATHFSILQELTNTLIAPLEAQGYTLPQHLMPDISQGKMFCKFARDELGIDTDALPTYPHEFEDGRVVDAKLYPVEMLGKFRTYIVKVWLSERAAEYFKAKDPKALPYLDRFLQLTEGPSPGGTPKRRIVSKFKRAA